MRPYLILLGFCLLAGCRKYPDAPPVGSPAYIRVFNDIPFTQTPFNIGGVVPFLTFLMDPVVNDTNVITGASVTGDFLSIRQTFSTSYALNENTSSLIGNAAYPTNFDYPGNAHVPVAPVLNGFNMSAWAAVPSGRHRIVLLARPTTKTPFAQLPAEARQTGNILIDTTLDLSTGEVYTLEAVARNLIANANVYGLYVRQERFIHQTFYGDRLYVGFYNLSAPGNDFPDTLSINYAYYTHFYGLSYTPQQANPPVPGYDNQYFTTLQDRFADTASWLSLPLLAKAYYYDPQGFLGTYGGDLTGYGTLPFVQFNLSNNVSFTTNANPDSVNLAPAVLIGSPQPLWVPCLTQITRVDTAVTLSATVNIIELINNQVCMMQVQRAAGYPSN